MSEPGPVRVRFAPSPTGRIHVGNARTALYNWLLARSRWGAFVLRIEDTDLDRNEAGSESAILDDLRWLGLDWDEGPDLGGPHGPYRQSERGSSYRAASDRLLAQGDVYRCFCSQETLAQERESRRASGLPPRYNGRCRPLAPSEAERRAAAGEPFVLRLKVPQTPILFDDAIRGKVRFPADQVPDVVLVRSDGRPSYNYAVVIDDLEMRITHVVRGEDHLSNTPAQVLLYRALGQEPPVFAHLSMILGPDGGRLSKRHGAVSISQFREAGVAPEALVNYLVLLGWSHPDGKEILDREEMVRAFTLDRVSGSAGIFDPAKLAFLNAHHLRTMAPGRLRALAAPFLEGEPSACAAAPEGATADWLGRALAAVSGQMETLRDAGEALGVFFDPFAGPLAPAEPGEGPLLEAFEREAAGRDLTVPGAFREWASAVSKAAGVKGRGLFHPLRVALTNREKGPELDRLVPLIEEGGRLAPARGLLPVAERLRERRKRIGAGSGGAA